MLADRQQEEISRITQGYEEEKRDLDNAVQARRAEMQQRFDGDLERIRERAAVRCNALVADDDVKDEALFTLNQKISEMLRNADSNARSVPAAPRGSISVVTTETKPARSSSSRVKVKKVGLGHSPLALGRRSSRSTRSRTALGDS
jgi:hypothetical protein